MSRTYRRKENSKRHFSYYFLTHESIVVRTDSGEYHHHMWVKRDTKSKEYLRDMAKFYSDSGTFKFKEPGPSWFRNLYTERTQRREAKRQLRKYLLDQEFEVILNPKDKLEYWT